MKLMTVVKNGKKTAFPIASKRPHELIQHGQTRIDNYYWMRNRNDPEVIDYLHAQNAYLEEVLGASAVLRNTLYEEMKARILEDDSSVPEQRGGYFYYTRTAARKQYPLYCRKAGSPEAPPAILTHHTLSAPRT